MATESRAAVLVGLASEQWGLVTSRQAGSYVGVSPQQLKKLADSGMLERVRHGMYRVARFPYDQYQDLRVAWMALDPDRLVWQRLDDQVPVGVVSHRSAALMLGLGDAGADAVELTCQRRVRLSIDNTVIHRGHLERDDWEVVEGLPVTTALRTIADLAAAGIDAGHLAGVVRDALTRSLVSTKRAAEVLAEHAYSYGYAPFDGQGFLDALIEDAGVPESAMSLARIAAQQAVAGAADSNSLAAALTSLLPEGQFEAAMKRARNQIVHGGAGAESVDRLHALVAAAMSTLDKSPVTVDSALLPEIEKVRAALSPGTLRSLDLLSAATAPIATEAETVSMALTDPEMLRALDKVRGSIDPATLREAEKVRAALDPATLRAIRAAQRALGDTLR